MLIKGPILPGGTYMLNRLINIPSNLPVIITNLHLLRPEQVLTCKVPIVFVVTIFCPKWSHSSLPEHTPKLTKLEIYLTPAEKCHNLLPFSISTIRWQYNQAKCVLAYKAHILCRTFKNLISTRSLNCAESRDIGHADFSWPYFFRKFAKCRKPTFSNSSQAISPICTKLCTQPLCTLLTKSYYNNFDILNNTQVIK